MDIGIQSITIILISGILSYISNLFLLKFTPNYNILNKFKGRNFEQTKIPRLGGITIIISMLISLIIIRCLSGKAFTVIDKNVSYTLLFIGGLIILLLGIYDDLLGAKAFKKFFFQIIAAVIVYFGGFKIAGISIPFIGTKSLGFQLLSFILTIIWIVGITNAVNILDGLDGLAVGVSFFAALSLGVLAFLSNQYFIVIIIVALLGSMIGFYPFNFPKAKMYLGDSGSLLIGFLLASLSMIRIHRKGSLAIALMIPIIILLLPILETLVTIARRIYRKKSIFQGDTDHFHYRFLKKGFSETKTTICITFISFLFSLIGILFEYVQTRIRLLLFVLIFLICFFLLHYLEYINLRSREKA